MYLQFEYSSCSDMTRVLQLEKRRAQVFPELETTGIFPLLQRYHQLDLWPCSSADMFAFEGPVTIQEQPTRGPPPRAERPQSASAAASQLALEKASRFPKPNVGAMMPFKAEMALVQPLNSDQGASNAPQPAQISIPDVISQLINQLPSPGSYQGPFVDIEQLITLIVEANLVLPTSAPSAPVVPAPAKSGSSNESAKRKKGQQDSDSDGEEDEVIAKKHKPPSHDIYRKRQASNLKKQNT
eukprot:TRINITY_DN5045_c0_g1_i1.p1 TRINITY_DN5045_c0_g1~~TRINITY_DN5045_c0_g1_i1.p1  ORF type:complete len:262 (-),score=58.35 TRINITY_DN5045_c0_g1_i1:66-788(-)